ncbi:MAG: 4-alpha-glucanotransferase [Xanthobacteraceae bacterium]
MDDAVRELAREAGIANEWTDAADKPQGVSLDTLRSILTALELPCATKADIAESRARLREQAGRSRTFFTATAGCATPPLGLADAGTEELVLESGERQPVVLRAQGNGSVMPPIKTPGYHRLRVSEREITLAVAPARCVTFEDVAPGEKLWGLGVQLYSLRRAVDAGFGDTAALRELIAGAAREGADAIALSPAHSLFAADSTHYGPYSPSNRLFLNPLYADAAVVLGEVRVAKFAAGESPPPSNALIDWSKAATTRYAMLRRLWDDFAANELHAGDGLAADFLAFGREGGERLHEHALFEALHRHWLAHPETRWSWRDWPAEWQAPSASAAVNFATAKPHEVQFHMFLQWLAARSFAAVQQDARRQGMRIGLIADVAVGMNPGGSHAWSRPQDLLLGLSVGAPPDLFSTRGQDWGLTAFSPQALLATGFEPFIATLRAAMRAAGGVRIDHAMGLTRLWLVPRGASPAEGAYLSYPLNDLLRLIALESHRHHAIVIGEDLGTVEPEFRERMAEAGIAGMDVLWFQREGKGFLPPAQWRHDAVAMTSTHDLPTIAGWWSGADITTRGKLGLADETRERKERARDRKALWSAFRTRGATNSEPVSSQPAPAVDAAIAFTAKSPAALALIPIEDVLGLAEQPNLPGTIDEHPNWRRRLDKPSAELLDSPHARARLKTLRER